MCEVTERALVGRINRALAKKNWRLHRTRRGTWSEVNLGRYYILDHYRNVANHHVDIEWLARDLNAMTEWERLSA
ncbi:MAG: hypothetical protein ACLP9L_22170 [Thermoguttaceae bacterium]